MAEAQVNPIELLKEEMDSDEISHRINAIHRLKIIATLLGPEGIRSQLLPLIDAWIKKEDDEVLFAIAEELGNVAPLLGAQSSVLITYLENLASVEETVVRDAATKSLVQLSSLLTDNDVVNLYVPMILKLAGGEWFTSRVAAVNLIPGIYPRAGSQKMNLKQKFIELCGEETPMVRRAVAMRIGDLASCVEKDVLHELITIFKQLTGDEQDSVKMLCLESLKQIAKILNKDENKTHIIPVIIAAAEDKSWRVRQALSKNFSQIAEALGKEITDYHLIQNFTSVLRDPEIDVRGVAVQSLVKVLNLNLLSNEKLLQLIPHIQALARDSNAGVKCGITQVLTSLVPLVGKEVAMSKLYQNALDLLEDEDSEVRIESFKVISKFAQISGPEILQTLLPHIKNLLTNNTKWRVRAAALDSIVDLAVLFQNFDLFRQQLEPLFLLFQNDRACSVRELGIKRIPDLVQAYKIGWVDSSLLPKLVELQGKETTYLIKATSIYSLKAIASAAPNDYVGERIVPLLVKVGKDSVPNVRFVVVKVVRAILNKIDPPVLNSAIKPLLSELANDSDKDVQFYAQETLASL